MFGSIFKRVGEGRGGEQIFLKFDCIAIIIIKLISNLNINLVTTFIIIRLSYSYNNYYYYFIIFFLTTFIIILSITLICYI